jgi:heme-degrading monooxygenase HmoA
LKSRVRPGAEDGSFMFLVLWEYEVKSGSEKQFEEVYGPAGDWARLFRTDSQYRETRLLRDPFRSNVYLTLDFWASRDSYEQFLVTHKAEYQSIDALGESLTTNERRLGACELVAP